LHSDAEQAALEQMFLGQGEQSLERGGEQDALAGEPLESRRPDAGDGRNDEFPTRPDTADMQAADAPELEFESGTGAATQFAGDADDDFSVDYQYQPPTGDQSTAELSLDELELTDGPQSWSEAERAELELPEIEWADPPSSEAAQPEDAELSFADVLAAPVAALNPPASTFPPSLLPPP